ncbi:hypothetical protein AMK26_04810 [Streptomyces sp. CB03234]|uniref:hypothetical protein n=1 Tax=Streptomyces sp. (strain CB03234) TaxID=1703937 RepID=UPI0009390D26|nr:hypothetical protein [Streptomyces sp. CB03234]OKK08336.1 hypothetical protein AMK26_04810 [Streptomyces sp. CB03234]
MGWTVLYIAFGVVALWLLGEVLLQYKARLRWRLLAFAGFLGVVLGVLLPSVPVIAAGAIAFAIGQTYVTLSFRRGFSTGWALGGRPGASRRRRAGNGTRAAGAAGPTLEVSNLAYEHQEPTAAETTAVYAPEPLPDETGQYAVYNQPAPTAHTASYDGGFDNTYAATGYDQQGTYATATYDYGTAGEQSYAAYSDPYIGTAPYDNSGYGEQQQYADPYAPQYGMETPPGGVWVPQQRDAEHQAPQQPPYGYDPGQGEPYRY